MIVDRASLLLVFGDERVPAVFPVALSRAVREGLESRGLQESRRPDSNRGPLHYEGGGLETAPPATIANAGIPSPGHTGETGDPGHSGCSVVPATFPERSADGHFTGARAERCIACGQRLKPRDPTPYCAMCWDGQHGHRLTRRACAPAMTATRHVSSKAVVSPSLVTAFDDLSAHALSSNATVAAMSDSTSRRGGVTPTPWQQRFWRYLTPGAVDECWEWQGSRDAHGYGRLNRGGRNGSHVKAHRASYEIHYGPFDPEFDVCHRCDNPPCCNPAHLFLGDARANARDMASKGRAPAQRGHSNGREKLSGELVREIRERAAAGDRHVDLAREYGLRGQYIAALVYGQRRRRAGGPIREAGS